MKLPARMAFSDCCDRAAQSSSGKIDALDGEMRERVDESHQRRDRARRHR